MPQTARHHIHLISDSTGETLHAMARAGLALFTDPDAALHVSVFVRSERDLDIALETVREHPGLVLHTVIDPDHRRRIETVAAELGLTAFPALDGMISVLSRLLGQPPIERAGRQHRLSDEYFRRIDALDFAIANDDGALGQRLKRADVILTGVSRTSKTPTSIYLAYRGIRAANVPLLPRRPPEPALVEAIEAGAQAVGLTASPARLAQIRAHRLEALGEAAWADYASIEHIREEVADARLFFERHRIPVIDVTRRSIEETAAEIQALLRARQEALEAAVVLP
ncbi:MAG TPA: pyruvate, water dikinase regulatory protein [Thermohalobaculum sp.]|nr:pyruvate, water dikinase regulatory protein [Thermohalobaculum sp.]